MVNTQPDNSTIRHHLCKKFLSAWIILWPYVAIASIAALSLAHLLTGGDWIVTFDASRYVFDAYDFHQALINGFWYPRYLPNAHGGFGYPPFLFYQPLWFYLTAFVYTLTANMFMAFKLSILLTHISIGIGAYCVAKRLLDSKFLSLALAAMYVWTPYLYVNIYNRGDLTEYLAMGLLFWPLLAFLNIKDGLLNGTNRKPFVWSLIFALTTALVVYAHPLVAAMALPCFGFILLAQLIVMPRGQRGQLMAIMGIATILAAVLSAPYWAVAAYYKQFIFVETFSSGYYTPEHHGVYWTQFLKPLWGYGPSVEGPDDQMSFQLGAIHFLLAIAGVCLIKKDKWIRVLIVPYFGYLWAMSFGWLWLLGICPALKSIHFPWRMLSVVVFIQWLMMVGAFQQLNTLRQKWQVFILVILMGGILCVHYPQFFGVFSNETRQTFERRNESPFHYFEPMRVSAFYIPKTAWHLREPRGFRPLVELKGEGLAHPNDDSTPYRIRYTITTTTPSRVLINQVYLPGWFVSVNRQPIPATELRSNITNDGRLTLNLPTAGTYHLEAYFNGPPFKTKLAIIVGILTFALFVMLMSLTKPSLKSP